MATRSGVASLRLMVRLRRRTQLSLVAADILPRGDGDMRRCTVVARCVLLQLLLYVTPSYLYEYQVTGMVLRNCQVSYTHLEVSYVHTGAGYVSDPSRNWIRNPKSFGASPTLHSWKFQRGVRPPQVHKGRVANVAPRLTSLLRSKQHRALLILIVSSTTPRPNSYLSISFGSAHIPILQLCNRANSGSTSRSVGASAPSAECLQSDLCF